MKAYYNENDAFAAQWLKALINAKLIADGEVDQRSIEEIKPDDLNGFTQCHFFAGIGGWSYALRLAGWPDDRPVWTGSCPCQPLSSAGQRKGHADKRHLWPAFYSLIAERKPSVVFGEQVASKDGREWLAGIRADLEAVGYACGAADLCSASLGAPHIRQRLYWVADSERAEWREINRPCGNERQDSNPQRKESSSRVGVDNQADAQGLADPNGSGEYKRASGREQSVCDAYDTSIEGMDDTDGIREGWEGNEEQGAAAGCNDLAWMGNAESSRPQEQWCEYRPSGERHRGFVGFAIEAGVPQWNGPTIAVECSDGWRRVSAQSNAFPLAHGVSARMGKLRGAGNAITPQLAQAFIEAWLES